MRDSINLIKNIKPIIKAYNYKQPNEISAPVYAFSGVKTITLNNFSLSPTPSLHVNVSHRLKHLITWLQLLN